MIDTNKKTVLVTGGTGSGVGYGICKILYQNGYNLVLHGRRQESIDRVKDLYPNAEFAIGDLSDATAIENMFADLKSRGIKLDGLVNNAGIGLSKPAHTVTEEEYMNIFNVDVKAVFLLSKYFLTQALENNIAGSIVNISSVHAHSTIPRYAVYAGCKGNVEAFTRGLAVDYGKHNININCIAPGYVHSDQNYELIATWAPDPKAWVDEHSQTQQCIEREVTPEECGYLADFLLSDKAKMITGQTIRIDGGSTALLYNKNFL